MKPLHDYRCGRCDHTFEIRARQGDTIECPHCGSSSTRLVFLSGPSIRGAPKDPYDALDRVIPDSKPIKSFARDRRTGGKNTT